MAGGCSSCRPETKCRWVGQSSDPAIFGEGDCGMFWGVRVIRGGGGHFALFFSVGWARLGKHGVLMEIYGTERWFDLLF
jgi:hypothetical protein